MKQHKETEVEQRNNSNLMEKKLEKKKLEIKDNIISSNL